jgi:hypothetical protein
MPEVMNFQKKLCSSTPHMSKSRNGFEESHTKGMHEVCGIENLEFPVVTFCWKNQHENSPNKCRMPSIRRLPLPVCEDGLPASVVKGCMKQQENCPLVMSK